MTYILYLRFQKQVISLTFSVNLRIYCTMELKLYKNGLHRAIIHCTVKNIGISQRKNFWDKLVRSFQLWIPVHSALSTHDSLNPDSNRDQFRFVECKKPPNSQLAQVGRFTLVDPSGRFSNPVLKTTHSRQETWSREQYQLRPVQSFEGRNVGGSVHSDWKRGKQWVQHCHKGFVSQ